MKKNPLQNIATTVAVYSLLIGPLLGEEVQPTATPSSAVPPFEMTDVSKLSSQMMTQIFDESLKPERAVQLARFQKLYYDALVKEGFSKQEALEILKAGSSSIGTP